MVAAATTLLNASDQPASEARPAHVQADAPQEPTATDAASLQQQIATHPEPIETPSSELDRFRERERDTAQRRREEARLILSQRAPIPWRRRLTWGLVLVVAVVIFFLLIEIATRRAYGESLTPASVMAYIDATAHVAYLQTSN